MGNEVISSWRVSAYTGGQGNCVEVSQRCRRGCRPRHKEHGERPCAALRP